MTMAAAAAGGGLLTAAAGAAPAYAAATAAPPGGHTVTITAHPRARATSGISPHINEEPLPQTITCWLTAGAPYIAPPNGFVQAVAHVHCDYPVAAIHLQSILARGTVVVGTDVDAEDSQFGQTEAGTNPEAFECVGTTYSHLVGLNLYFPAEYTPSTWTTHLRKDRTFTSSACLGGGGGGGCAVTSPSSSAQPAAIRPRAILCP
jgi:hypothetical protein